VSPDGWHMQRWIHNAILFDNKLIFSFEVHLFCLSGKVAAHRKIKVPTVVRKSTLAGGLPTMESRLISFSGCKT
jgi:hypothetical protein